MTQENPTPQTGTPLWQPSGTTQQPTSSTPAPESEPVLSEPALTQPPDPTPAVLPPYQPATTQPPAPQPLYQGAIHQPPYQALVGPPPSAAPMGQPPYQGAPPQQPYQPVMPQQVPYQGQVPYGQPQQYPYQSQPQQYGYQQGPIPYGPQGQPYAVQQGFAPYPPPPDWGYLQQFVPVKPSALPVEPKRYSQFLQTPRRRFWKGILGLLVAVVAWLIEQTVVVAVALIYDGVNQRIDGTDAQALIAFLNRETTHITPAFFLANNISIVLMIPCAWLGLVFYGQRPRWLSSVVGGLRWGWLFRILGLLLLPYIALEVLSVVLGQVPQLSWKPYSLFMIFAVLLTTPLQCAGEEYGLRGFINRLFGSYGSSRTSFWIGGIVSSLLFMLLHNVQDIYLNIFYFTFAMLSCWMAWRTGGLEAGIAMHVVNNMFAMAVLPFTDFSGMFDRGAGSSGSLLETLPLAAVLLACVGIVEWQARTRKPIAVAAPGAALSEGQIVALGVPQAQMSI